MQLRIHEHLQKNQERSIRTFEHFLGHFFAKYMPMEDWKMEVWLVENDQLDIDDAPLEEKMPKFNCGIILTRPDKENIYAQKMGSNLSGAIFYAIKSVHRKVVKDAQNKNSLDKSDFREAR